MYLLDGVLVTSASDLTVASGCEFAFVRGLERRLGWRNDARAEADPFLARLSRLGDEHERRHLAALRAEFPGGVVDVGDVDVRKRVDLERAAATTVGALVDRTPVVFQAAFFDESDPAHPSVGLADFLVLGEAGYRVVDTKLARRAKVTALLQLAAYHEQLVRLGVPADPVVELRLGDGTADRHEVADIAPVHRRRRDRLHRVLDGHLADARPVTWGDERYVACGRCDVCQAEIDAADDVARVPGLRTTQRAALRAAGVTTVAGLAELVGLETAPAGLDLSAATFARVVTHARLLAQADAQRANEPAEGPHAPPPYDVADLRPIGQLPPPDRGDLFFDFEGDPMWRTEGAEPTWGLDYLFGWVDAKGAFSSLWADDLAEEKAAFESFIDFLVERRGQHPGLHVYHYAAYERTHLTSLAQRHGTREHVVDQLLRDGVLVDLYPVVRRTVRVGTTSYSLKQLEPLYDEAARSGVTNAADSVMAYVEYGEALDAGDPAGAAVIKTEILDYNADDCRSTRHLRDWLVGLGEARGVQPGDEPRPELEDHRYEESELAVRLEALAAAAREHGDDAGADAYALAAAAVDYHARENRAFWWEHFARLSQPADEWQDTRGVFTVDRAETDRDWHTEGRQRNPRRHLRLHGRWAPGSSLPGAGDQLFLLYDPDLPPYVPDRHRPGDRLARTVTVLEADEESGTVQVAETTPDATWSVLPTHLAPDAPPRATNLKTAIDTWADEVASSGWPDDAASLLVRRLPPRLPPVARSDADDTVHAVVASLLADDDSYIAVQGPPGTGKTYVASHAITTLVAEHGWKVGVVAQSHKVVENLLCAVVRAGLDRRLVAKAPRRGVTDPTDEGFTWLSGTNPQAAFAAAQAATGYVLGGTAWDFTNRNRVLEGQLDLLVIEEAGQFSLAPTIAVAPSASRLLLLGDPQQLPQVSQGIHPAPVDESALAHLAGGEDVLPDGFGYFLAETRRMHGALTSRVSDLAYRGELRAHASTGGRSLPGIDPGVHRVLVEHEDNDVCSPEEAAAVVDLVRSHLGLTWSDGGKRVLGERDVLVVTPYNAQVELVRAALVAAGFADVQVGTVDKFQGREAVVVIVSMAASSPGDVPRGLGFLLSRNRLNVSVSRAQWAAYVVHSPALVDYLPTTVPGLTDLARFLRLIGS